MRPLRPPRPLRVRAAAAGLRSRRGDATRRHRRHAHRPRLRRRRRAAILPVRAAARLPGAPMRDLLATASQRFRRSNSDLCNPCGLASWPEPDAGRGATSGRSDPTRMRAAATARRSDRPTHTHALRDNSPQQQRRAYAGCATCRRSNRDVQAVVMRPFAAAKAVGRPTSRDQASQLRQVS